MSLIFRASKDGFRVDEDEETRTDREKALDEATVRIIGIASEVIASTASCFTESERDFFNLVIGVNASLLSTSLFAARDKFPGEAANIMVNGVLDTIKERLNKKREQTQ